MMYGGFGGWHLVIILFVLLLLLGGIAGVVALVLTLTRRSGGQPAAAAPAPGHPLPSSARSRLDELDQLHREARISDEEYQHKRAEILRDL